MKLAESGSMRSEVTRYIAQIAQRNEPETIRENGHVKTSDSLEKVDIKELDKQALFQYEF